MPEINCVPRPRAYLVTPFSPIYLSLLMGCVSLKAAVNGLISVPPALKEQEISVVSPKKILFLLLKATRIRANKISHTYGNKKVLSFMCQSKTDPLAKRTCALSC